METTNAGMCSPRSARSRFSAPVIAVRITSFTVAPCLVGEASDRGQVDSHRTHPAVRPGRPVERARGCLGAKRRPQLDHRTAQPANHDR